MSLQTDRSTRAGAGVQQAEPQDLDALAAVLARAFADDPFFSWLVRSDRPEAGMLRCFRAYTHKLAWPHKLVFTLPGREAASLWIPPGEWDLGLLRQLALFPDMLSAIGLKGFVERFQAIQTVQDRHPQGDGHYYLLALGTDPSHQGKGLGSALLNHFHPRADRERKGCYLETAKERNVRFYEKHGYAVLEEIRPAPSAPPVWLMWREPK